MLKFDEFLKTVEKMSDLKINKTRAGQTTIQQTTRNKLRTEAEMRLYQDLYDLYQNFDILKNDEGICFVARNAALGADITFALKLSIKSLDFDAYENAVDEIDL